MVDWYRRRGVRGGSKGYVSRSVRRPRRHDAREVREASPAAAAFEKGRRSGEPVRVEGTTMYWVYRGALQLGKGRTWRWRSWSGVVAELLFSARCANWAGYFLWLNYSTELTSLRRCWDALGRCTFMTGDASDQGIGYQEPRIARKCLRRTQVQGGKKGRAGIVQVLERCSRVARQQVLVRGEGDHRLEHRMDQRMLTRANNRND